MAQPAIVRASLAGLRWLDLLGVRAEAAVGHSLGELTALVWAGALTEDEAYTLATRRGAVMAAASAEPAGMASLATDLAGATDLVAGTGAVVAADNAVRQVVVAGRRADVAAVVAAATERGVAATWLPVAHAFHSGLMAPAAQPLRMAAGQVAWHPPTRPVASTVTGTWWDGADPVELLVRQLTAPVRFREALALLDVDLFVEVGPGRILAGLTGTPTAALDVGTGSAEGLATATAALFAAGACDSVEAYLSRRATRPFDPAVPRRFLTNPCESGATPVPEPAGARRQVPVSAPEAVAAEPGTPRSDPLSAVTAHVAAAVDLDESAITPDARLLADLHLSSLRVGQLAAEVATALGRALPVAPLSLATASVAEFATAIAELPTADAAGGPPAPGVAAWVRVFGHHRVPRSAPDTPPVPRDWRLVGNLAGHPYAVQVRDAFRPGSGAPPARLLALPPGLVELPVDDIAAALRDSDADRVPLVVVHHQGVGAAVGRSLAAENPAVPVLVVEVPDSPAGIGWAAAEAHRAWTGFVEAAYDPTGVRAAPVTRPMEVSPRRDAEIPLGPGDVCLVTGGAKGIGAECAAALATATGATMVLLGRSPADDPEVRATLSRISGAAYRTVDLTDPAAVGATLAEVRAALGPVRVLLHAAGTNVPGRLAELTGQRLRAALAAKAAGLDHVLAALDLTQLRYGVTFGSVIGRTGLAGEADYAIANEWLARRCFELSLAVPEVRWLNIEWSAWTGVGMGVRLGALDGLVRQGLSPIPVEEGTDLLLRVLATPALPPTVMIAGRLPATPTLRWETADEESARFLETRLGWTSGVELVAEAALSLGTDPYLADHRIDGVAVLPAVLGLEAMAQAATALGAKPVPAVFEDVRLAAPVTVPERGSRVLRVAALVRDGGIDMVARSAETGFAVDHLAVRCRAATSPLPPPSGAALDGPLLDAAALYGPLFFHGPRFQRVTGYGGLSAYRCLARVTVRDQQRWFGSFQPQRLELGDPGARDAFLHVLQGCVPDRRVLPTGVERLVVHRRAEGTVTVDARQRDEDGDRYVFDMSIRDGDGGLVEEWYGLALRGIAPLHRERWPVELLGAYLTRSLRRWRPQVGVDLAVAAGARGDPQRTRDVAGWLAGTPVTHAGDGRPVAVDGTAVSASHLDGRLLVAAGPAGTAVDWQRVAAVPLVDPATGELARRGEDPAVAATRIWTCREVLAKHGAAPDAPLVVDVAGPDGWFLLRSGGYALYSVAVPTDGAPVAVCVGAGEPDA
ncbi:MAG: hypothetical protein AUI14_20275 [Actinobacteria bacterium 13_2_20CM_2_71_6]|nr:MAG: hypothetical protein AUI14_20275 [Actinobacteria bacterium 13_2_20CM_2_71_6]